MWREGRSRHFGNIKTNNTTLTLFVFCRAAQHSPPRNKKGLKQKKCLMSFHTNFYYVSVAEQLPRHKESSLVFKGAGFGECERDPGRSALDCCRREGSEPSTEASHWTSAKGCVNAFSRPLHITGAPPSGYDGSRLNLWPGQKVKTAGETHCFCQLHGCASGREPETFGQVRTEKRISPAAWTGGFYLRRAWTWEPPSARVCSTKGSRVHVVTEELSAREGRGQPPRPDGGHVFRPSVFMETSNLLYPKKIILCVKAAQSDASSPFCFQSKLAAVSRRNLDKEPLQNSKVLLICQEAP